jgi:hypothetical protein
VASRTTPALAETVIACAPFAAEGPAPGAAPPAAPFAALPLGAAEPFAGAASQRAAGCEESLGSGVMLTASASALPAAVTR